MSFSSIWGMAMDIKKIGLSTALLMSSAMAYTPYVGNNYTAADIPPIAIDAVGHGGVQVVAFAGLITLAVLAEWFYARLKGR